LASFRISLSAPIRAKMPFADFAAALRFGGAAVAAQHHGEIARGFALEEQRLCSSARPITSRSAFSARAADFPPPAPADDAQVLASARSGIWPRIHADAVELAVGELRLAPHGADFSAAAQRQRIGGSRHGSPQPRRRLIGSRQTPCRARPARGTRWPGVHAIRDARLHAGAMVGGGGDLPRGDGFGVAATQMTDDAQIVRGATVVA